MAEESVLIKSGKKTFKVELNGGKIHVFHKRQGDFFYRGSVSFAIRGGRASFSGTLTASPSNFNAVREAAIGLFLKHHPGIELTGNITHLRRSGRGIPMVRDIRVKAKTRRKRSRRRPL